MKAVVYLFTFDALLKSYKTWALLTVFNCEDMTTVQNVRMSTPSKVLDDRNVNNLDNLKMSALSTVLDDNLLGGLPRRRTKLLYLPNLDLVFKR